MISKEPKELPEGDTALLQSYRSPYLTGMKQLSIREQTTKDHPGTWLGAELSATHNSYSMNAS